MGRYCYGFMHHRLSLHDPTQTQHLRFRNPNPSTISYSPISHITYRPQGEDIRDYYHPGFDAAHTAFKDLHSISAITPRETLFNDQHNGTAENVLAAGASTALTQHAEEVCFTTVTSKQQNRTIHVSSQRGLPGPPGQTS